ncbi:MAG: FG-GAP-like repeat-containing protein, partial [Candidatus Moraniibacteriota bacterium]
SLTTTANSADVIITGVTAGDYFGYSLVSGDFNADGTIDLAVGAYTYSSSTGLAYIFHNDGSIPTTAATADVTITGETTNNQFGVSLSSGDFNADGETDLAVGAYGYSSSTGRAYIFHNDGSIPTTAGTADVTITGETTTNYFGYTMTAGDFNADSKTDLAVGAHRYSSFNGRAYIFHNDGSIPTTAATADVTITGEAASEYFGASLASGDWNADGRTDLAIGAFNYSGGAGTGRVYIFNNDGSIPTTAATADIILTGETTSNFFGVSLTSGDWNADGRTDLAVGATGYSSSTGRAYVYTWNDPVITGGAADDLFGASLSSGDFNADGKTDLAVGATYANTTGRVYIFFSDGTSIPATADVTITGDVADDSFGYALVSGDFNADSKIDLVVSALGYSTSTGRAYIFYNDGSIPTTAATADVTITGGATVDQFGASLVAGDFNADGETDLAVGANNYSSGTGRVYIFHNDGSIPTTAATADVTITGGAIVDTFGASLTAGDFNADGKTDLAIGASGYSSYTGRAYIYYNDGSIPTTAGTADVTITGGAGDDKFGVSLISGDFNTDGKTDLVVGANNYASTTGRAYIFHNDGSIPTTAATADVTITGEAGGDQFAASFAAGDWNADGKTDLVISAYGHSAGGGTGRTYIYYNDGSIPTTAATADVTITGEATFSYFGYALSSGDFNTDGKIDLAIGAYGYSTSTGRVYIIASEAAVPAVLPATLYQKGMVKTKGTLKLK